MKTTLINISAACLLALAMTACSSDDEKTFGVTPDAASVSFTPRSGGAVMHYALPSNLDIQSIRVRYTDAQGKEDIVEGSYLADSLTLVGFNEARTDVPAYISYVNRQGDVSQETSTTFSTKNSGPCAFFKDAEVKSAWNGVELSYNLPDPDMKGFAHIFYIGTDPTTDQPDTILAKTINLQQGENSSFIKFEQEMEDYDIIVRTEDFRGYFVQSKEWKDIKSYQTEKFPEDQLKVTCPSSVEDDDAKIGLKYLTDGDDRGYHLRRLLLGIASVCALGHRVVLPPSWRRAAGWVLQAAVGNVSCGIILGRFAHVYPPPYSNGMRSLGYHEQIAILWHLPGV